MVAADTAPPAVAAGGGALNAREVKKNDYGMRMLLSLGCGDTKNPAGRRGRAGFTKCDDLHQFDELPACLPVKVRPADGESFEALASCGAQHTGTARPLGRQLVLLDCPV